MATIKSVYHIYQMLFHNLFGQIVDQLIQQTILIHRNPNLN